MYDDSRADEATITVIATGLHNVGGSASKLKARLENPRVSSVPHTAATHAQGYERPVQPAQTSQASPRIDFGMAPTKGGGTTTAAKRSVGGTTPSLETPRTPTSKVKEQSIKIPDFFKK